MATSADEVTNREIFAGEVFDFFSSNAKTWPRKPEYFPLYDLSKGSKNTSFLNLNVKEAIVTLAYIFRFECRKKFGEMSDNLKIAECYGAYLMLCEVPNALYFLTWIAFLLELTTYCYLEGYDHSEKGQECLVNYSKNFLFCGWEEVKDAVDAICVFHDPLRTSFSVKLPKSDIMAPFLKALNDIMKYDKYGRMKRNMGFYRQGDLKSISENLPTKLCDLSFRSGDLASIRFGYLVKRKNEGLGKLRDKQKVCSPTSKNPRSRKMKIKSRDKSEDDIIGNISSQVKNLTVSGDSASAYLGGKSGHKAKYLSTVASAGPSVHLNETQSKINELKDSAAKFDEIKRGIVITGKYLEKIRNEMMNEQEQNCKIDIKVYSPSKKTGNVIEKLGKVFIDNIDKGNIKEYKGLHAVDPQDWEDNRVIVLNSSDEEDDDEFDSSQLSIIHHVCENWTRLDYDDIFIMQSLINWRVWEAKRRVPSSNTAILNENPSGAYSEALARTSNAGNDLSPELDARDMPELNRRKVTVGKKREWRKNPVKRN